MCIQEILVGIWTKLYVYPSVHTTVDPLVSDHPKCKGLVVTWGGGGAVAYESRTARLKFISQPRMEWYVYLLKVYFPLTITGSFYDKIISHCMCQFIYGSAIN